MNCKKFLTIIILIMLNIGFINFSSVRAITLPTWSVEAESPSDFEILYDCDTEEIVFSSLVNITNNDASSVTFTIESVLNLGGHPIVSPYADLQAPQPNITVVIISSWETKVIKINILYRLLAQSNGGWWHEYFGEWTWSISTTLTDSSLTFSETKNTEERTMYATNIQSYIVWVNIYNPTNGEHLPYGDVEFNGQTNFAATGSSHVNVHWNYESKINGQTLESGSTTWSVSLQHVFSNIIDTSLYSLDAHNYSLSLWNLYLSHDLSTGIVPIPSKSATVTWYREPNSLDWSVESISPQQAELVFDNDETTTFRIKVNINDNNIGETLDYTTKSTLIIWNNPKKTVYDTKTINGGETDSIFVNITYDVASLGWDAYPWWVSVELYYEQYPSVRETKITNPLAVLVADFDSIQTYCEMSNPQINGTIPYEDYTSTFSGTVFFELINPKLPVADYHISFSLQIFVGGVYEFGGSFSADNSFVSVPFQFLVSTNEFSVGIHTIEIEITNIQVEKDLGFNFPDRIFFLNWYRAEPPPELRIFMVRPADGKNFEYDVTETLFFGKLTLTQQNPSTSYEYEYYWYIDDELIYHNAEVLSETTDSKGYLAITVENTFNISLYFGDHETTLRFIVYVPSETYEGEVTNTWSRDYPPGENPSETTNPPTGTAEIGIIFFAWIFTTVSTIALVIKRRKASD